MRRLLRTVLWGALASSMGGLLGAGNSANASGYLVPEMDAEASAQAAAWTARARGASAIFYNPAGLTQLKGFEFSLGTTLVDLQATASDLRIGVNGLPLDISTDSENPIAPPSHAYFGYKLGDKLALGMGVHTSFGLAFNWPQEWPEGLNFGSFVIEEVDLKTFNFNPTVAYAVNDKLSIGVGLQAVISHAILENQTDLSALAAAFQAAGVPVPGLRPLQLRLDAKGDPNFGFNVGVLYNTEKFGVGATYRSQVDLKLEGDADFTTPITGIAQLDATLAGLFPDQTGSTEIPLADIAAFGVSYRPNSKTEVEVDVNWANWKDFDEFTIDFSKNTALPGPGGVSIPVLRDRTSIQNWKNGFTLRVGGSYDLTENLEWRAGLLYDPAVVPEENLRPLLPESDRVGASTGFGLNLGSLDLDVFYFFIKIPERTSNQTLDPLHPEEPFNATFNGRAHLAGVTFSFGS